MNKRIEKIPLTRFRGATTTTEIVFDPAKPVVFIFGENGAGKSSLVDAIDFVCNQTSSLSDRSSTKPKDHLLAIGHKAKDIHVELECSGQTWNAKFSGAKIVAIGAATLPVAHVLWRTRLLTLIDATPAERYKQLQKFIEVEGIEQSEQTLRDAVREQVRTLDEKSRAKVEAETELERFWMEEGMAGAPAQTALMWAAQQAAADWRETQARLEALQDRLDRLDTAVHAHDGFQGRQSIQLDQSVLSSGDRKRRRIARSRNLLLAECERFNQIIITTHNRQWRDRYASELPTQSCFVELQSWTRANGIRTLY